MAPTGQAYNIDWIFSNNTNVHVAKHRDWFTAYTAFPSETTDGAEVLGIGDVELDVRTSATQRGPASHGKIVLRDVLYVPSATCNILGGPIMNDFAVSLGGGGGKLIDPETGACKGLLELTTLYKLWLFGQSRGRSSLNPNGVYLISASWSDSERARWEAAKARAKAPSARARQTANGNEGSRETGADARNPPYTTAEKAWLRRAWGDEFHFLQAYGLKIYSEEDRAEGRAIARAMMEEDAADN